MSVATAITHLEGLRCEGVAEAAHYGFADAVSPVPEMPVLIWRYVSGDEWDYASEVYDLRSAVLGVEVSVTLLLTLFRGPAQVDAFGELALWADRVLAMLGADVLLSDSLSSPVSGVMTEVGIVGHGGKRFVGLVADLRLPVRITAA